VGKIVKEPVVIEEAIGTRPVVSLYLALGHRLLDGAVAAPFLQAVKHKLEKTRSISGKENFKVGSPLRRRQGEGGGEGERKKGNS